MTRHAATWLKTVSSFATRRLMSSSTAEKLPCREMRFLYRWSYLILSHVQLCNPRRKTSSVFNLETLKAADEGSLISFQ